MKSIVYVPLTQGRFVTVDLADWEKVSQYKWFLHKSGKQLFYARAKIPGRKSGILLHNFLFPSENGLEVAHIDGDGLNCCRDNMAHKTHQQNVWGHQSPRSKRSSEFRGVHKTRDGKRSSTIRKDDKQIHLGRFDSERDAAEIRDRAAREYYGSHAALNFPLSDDMRFCVAGHKAIGYAGPVCPACEAICRFDKEILKKQIKIEELQERLSSLRENWNGGAT